MSATTFGVPEISVCILCTDITGSGVTAAPDTTTGTVWYLATQMLTNSLQNQESIKVNSGGAYGTKNGKIKRSVSIETLVFQASGSTLFTTYNAIHDFIEEHVAVAHPNLYLFIYDLKESEYMYLSRSGAVNQRALRCTIKDRNLSLEKGRYIKLSLTLEES